MHRIRKFIAWLQKSDRRFKSSGGKIMYVKHLQEYLEKFTEGQQGRRGNAVSDAKIYIMTSKGYLEEIRRIEVHASNNPMDTSLRVVLKPNREEKLILPPGYIKDY